MFRALLRLVLILIVIAAAAAFFMGYRFGDYRNGSTSERPVATTGSGPAIDTTKARQTGAAIGEKVAESANRAEHALGDGALTAKIKSKMALDDTIDASDVSVSTAGTVVTLRGTIVNRKQHQRVVQLAQETAGVTSVVDKLSVREGR